MNQQEFYRLIDKYLAGKASEKEKEWLLRHYNRFQTSEEWKVSELGSSNEMEKKILQRITRAIHHTTISRPVWRRSWFMVAAVVLLVIGFSALWIMNRGAGWQQTVSTVRQSAQVGDSSETKLVLASGEVILPDKLADGVVSDKNSVQIKKSGNRLVFDMQNEEKARKPVMEGVNTIVIPRGRQYELQLTDGTEVWLNAATTLRFPSVFNGHAREVEATGEAFFKVAENIERPFRVYVSSFAAPEEKALVEVLGTEFNINSYTDEAATKTTLLEGKVRIMPVKDSQPETDKAKVLSPGQQAQFSTHSGTKEEVVIKAVDVEEVVAWKNNYFNFQAADIQSIMRQIARWYDVEVVYEGRVSGRRFTGKISRGTALLTLLDILEQSDIRFRVKGRKIMVKA